MYKLFGLFTVLLLLQPEAGAQVQEAEFFERVEQTYYTLDKTDLKNFSVWVTSNTFNEQLKELEQDGYFPLDFICVNPDKMFFIKRALPAGTDSTVGRSLEASQLSTQKELKAILVDWQRFYGSHPLSQLPPEYTFTVRNDTVHISYSTEEQGNLIDVNLYFGINGRCLKIITLFRDRDEVIYTYPEYRILRNKKLCKGWTVQIEKGGEIQSGFNVKVAAQSVENYILPQKIIMQLQTLESDNQLYVREYFLRNVRVNRDLQIMD